jgi:transposase
MVDSGMQEVTEYVTMIPKETVIVRQYSHKYRCTSCHGDIKTAPAAPRLIPGSSYGDEIIIDARSVETSAGLETEFSVVYFRGRL